MQILIFHQNKLDYFSLKLSERKSFHLENIHPTVVAYESLTHFKEDFGVVELRIRTVELAQTVAVIQHVTECLSVLLLVEVHGRKAHLAKFLIRLYPTNKLFKVYHRALKLNFAGD